MIHAEKEVPYSWWFKLAINNKNFGYQDYSTISYRWEKERMKASLRDDEKAEKLIRDKIKNINVLIQNKDFVIMLL